MACDLLLRDGMTTPTNQAITLDASREHLRAGVAALVGTSATVRGFTHALPSLGRTEVPLIITGEPGTGKSEWAAAIHRQSNRAGEQFYVVSMSMLAEARLERRLFGESGRDGVLAQACGSTIYLAGIETLSPRLQQRLAQWLAVENAGDVRVIAGSRVALDPEVRLGRFSRALFQRLALVQLTIAPLRERVDDVAAIVEDHLGHACSRSEQPPYALRESAFAELTAYPWPENVRELVGALTTVTREARTRTITGELVRRTLRTLARATPSLDVSPLERVESDYIAAALALCDGNQTLTARRLGIGRSTLLRKLKSRAPRRERAA